MSYSEMPDDPGFPPSSDPLFEPGSSKYWEVTYDFETVAVSSEGPTRGEVYGAITWGFSASWDQNDHSKANWKRYVDGTVWSNYYKKPTMATEWRQLNSHPPEQPVQVSLGGPHGKSVWNFSRIVPKEPSAQMKKVLDQYLP
jgi:hypothetical protein